MCGRPEKPPARYSATWTRPGRGRSASIERTRTASARRAAASAGGSGVDGRTSSSSRSFSRAASAVASSSPATRANSPTNVRHPRASARRSQAGADASAESSSALAANSRARARRREAPRPPFGALGLFALAGLVRVAAALVGPGELGDQPVERGRVTARAPADLRFAEGAGDRPGARPALGRAGKALERQRARGEGLPQDVRLEAAPDPLEKGQSRLARVREGGRDARRERARHLVLARELPRERGVGAGIGVENLDLVERDLVLEDASKDLADLVLFADGAHEPRPRCHGGPARGGLRREDLEPAGGDLFDERALDGGQVRVLRNEVEGRRGVRRRRLDCPPEHRGRVDEPALREVGVVAGEDAPELLQLAGVLERPGRQGRRGEAGGADLLERPLQRSMEPRPVAELPEVGLRASGIPRRPARPGRAPGRAKAGAAPPARAPAPTRSRAMVRTVATRRFIQG